MKRLRVLSSLLFAGAFCTSLFAQQFPYQDPGKTVDERVADLVSRMTLQEKAYQMMNSAPGIERLGLLPFEWWNEALHGVARTGRATVFPQNIGLAATFDPDLVKRIGEAISDEAWAKFNIAQRMQNYGKYTGLTFYAPNINIFRDPRWGRGQETYGEDPYLTSRMGIAYVQGMQGNDPHFLKTAACAKHYVVHSGPEASRHSFDAEPPMKDFMETYTPAFEALVKEGNVQSVMCAYNRTFGKPCCGSSFLLSELLRKRWGFQGYITTDCDAITNFYKHHGAAKDEADACALAIKSGVNLDCGNEFQSLPEAVKRGLITEKEIDQALSKLLVTRFKLGLLDPVNNNPYSKIGEEVIGCKKHVDLAYEAAAKSIVLLQNKNNLLPLKKTIKSIFVTGPYAASQDVLMGNYNGVSDHLTTVLEAIVGKVSAGTSVFYRQGVEPSAPNQNASNYAFGEGANSDVIVGVFGVSGVFEGEEGESTASNTLGDRLNLNIPQNQLDFLRTMKKRSKKPIVLILTGGSPVCTAELSEIADAIIFVWYPGQEGGRAVADALFGDVNPSGRLAITFPKSVDQLPAFDDYSMKGRTYRYMTAEPLYPFGFGLSYTSFQYSDIAIDKAKIKKGETVTVTTKVTNTGKSDGEEVVQLYVTDVKASTRVPLYSLDGVKRLKLKSGESQTVSFQVTPRMMELVNDSGDRVLESGDFKVTIAGSSPSPVAQTLGAATPASIQFTMK
ncbi:glycoside hydrolase family 3 N-terminal domain-containing protein [Paludibacter sp.]|uniref:glycoside hydrolase family 3 C-terminal domain-containing protein n=1 Tax=Paludibacter sp. TaxID=1898105 RepID=UPI001355BAF7|nr:glycoside hydrolase family 3 N-terminal domain-containing protein [Paludibacter sp.]MTK53589.1 glycoside hydrolase family 3 protein [Paludibacter sp.]